MNLIKQGRYINPRKLVKNTFLKAGYEVRKIQKNLPVLQQRKLIFDQQKINLLFDVGANRGQYASVMRDIGYRGRIVSFEPIQSVFTELEQKAKSDEQWIALHCGLGD